MIYLIGSLRMPGLEQIGNRLRAAGIDTFDDWRAPGPHADDEWMKYEKARGRTYADAITGYAAQHIFEFDKHHLDRADAALLVSPAGKSAHLELGYIIGKGKPGYILFTQEPERWDVMIQFATAAFFDVESMVNYMRRTYGNG